MHPRNNELTRAVRKALGIHPAGIGGAAVAIALSTGGIMQADAAGVTISGGTSGPVTNSSVIDFLLIDTGAVINGDVTNTPTGSITGLTGVNAIRIDASTINGSLINNGAVGTQHLDTTGVYITDTSLTGSITNNSVVRSSTYGIWLDTVSSTGGFSNTGLIQTMYTAVGIEDTSWVGGVGNSGTIISVSDYGIYVDLDTFAGGINNSGTIDSWDSGIYLDGLDTFSGGINNSGTIISGTWMAIDAEVSTFTGGITNSGWMTTYETGIYVEGDTFDGGISNTGTIHSVYSYGIYADYTNFTGGINNAGLVDSSYTGIELYASTFSGGIMNTGTILSRDDYGIYVDSTSFTGGINNAGRIDSESTGVQVYASTFEGGFTNSGTIISRDEYGVEFNAETFMGGFNNSGLIDSLYTALAIENVTTFHGGIVNTGTMISRDDEVIDTGNLLTFTGGINNSGLMRGQGSDGIDLSGVETFDGGIINSGTIIGNDGYGLYVDVDTFTGGIDNSGRIEGYSTGIYAYGTNFSGGIMNSGTIFARFYEGIYAGYDTFSGGINNSGLIDSTETGIYVEGTNFGGGIMNSGTIKSLFDLGIYVSSVETFSGGINNSGTIMARSETGVYVDATTFTGGIDNSGLIDSWDTGIYVYGATFDGGINNSGTVFSADSYGIYTDYETFSGGIDNSGLIEAWNTALYVSVDTFSGGINNSGTILSFTDYGIYVSGDTFNGGIDNSGLIQSQSTGLYVSVDTFFGGINNSGTISAYSEYGIELTGDTFVGGINNSGWMDSLYTGIYISSSVSFDGDIVNTGTIRSFSDNGIEVNTDDFTGMIDNAGLIEAQSTGIVVDGSIAGGITNTGTIMGGWLAIDTSGASGPTVINQNAGLISGAIQGAIELNDTHADTINVRGGTIHGDLWGGSDLNDTLAFMLNGNDASFHGNIDSMDLISVDPGTLTYDGYVTNTNTLFVDAGGYLVLRPSALVDVGTYTQDAAGTLGYELMPGGGSAQITAATATLAGTLELVPQDGVVYADNESYYSIIASPALTGTFSEVTSQSLFLTGTAVYGTTDVNGDPDVDLLVERIPFSAVTTGAALSSNQSSVAAGIEAGYPEVGTNEAADELYTALFQVETGEQYTQFLDAISGSTFASALQAGVFGTQSFNNIVQSRLGSIVGGVGGVNIAQLDAGSRRRGGAAGDPPFEMAAPGTWSAWISGYGGWGDVDGDNNAPGFDQDAYGVAFGVDYQLNEQWLLGVAGGYSEDDLDFDNGSDTEVESWHVAGYGQWDSGTWYANALFSYADNDFDSDRQVVSGLFPPATASSDTDGETWSVYGEGGYTFRMDNFELKPLFGIGWVDTDTDGFTETGAGILNLVVDDADATSWTTNLGARASAEWTLQKSRKLTAKARAVWQHELDDTTQEVDAALAAIPGIRFRVESQDISRDTGIFGVGLNLEVTPKVEVFADFDARVNSDYDTQSVFGGVRVSF